MLAATADSAVQQGVQIQLADPALATRSPGEEFAWSVRAAGQDQDHEVPFRAHLPAVFPLFATRPRYAVRHLLKTASVGDAPVTFVHEPPAADWPPPAPRTRPPPRAPSPRASSRPSSPI